MLGTRHLGTICRPGFGWTGAVALALSGQSFSLDAECVCECDRHCRTLPKRVCPAHFLLVRASHTNCQAARASAHGEHDASARSGSRVWPHSGSPQRSPRGQPGLWRLGEYLWLA